MKKLIFLGVFCLLPIFAKPNISLKLDTGSNIISKDQVKLTITIENKENFVVENSKLLLYLPKELSFIASDNGEYHPKNKDEAATVHWRFNQIKANEKIQVHTIVKSGISFSTYSDILAELIFGEVTINDYQELIVGDQQGGTADLTIKLDGNTKLTWLMRPITFTIIVENKGDAEARDIKVIFTLPWELEYISSKLSGTYNPQIRENKGTATWLLEKIKSKEKLELQVTARTIMGSLRTVAEVELLNSNCVLHDTFALRIRGGGLAMHLSTYDTEDPLEVSGQTIYVITARNEGTSACTNVNLVNDIPEGMEFISAERFPEAPAEPINDLPEGMELIEHNTEVFRFDKNKRQVKFFPYYMLQPGDSIVFKIVCRGIQAGSAKNTARLRYSEFDKEIIDEEGTSVYE